MAVIAVWKCDRDGSMFDDKKAADAHDKMLELAESITRLIEANIPTVSDEDVEAIGLLLAKRSDDLVKACKGKPNVLLEQAPTESAQSDLTDASEDSNVTALVS